MGETQRNLWTGRRQVVLEKPIGLDDTHRLGQVEFDFTSFLPLFFPCCFGISGWRPHRVSPTVIGKSDPWKREKTQAYPILAIKRIV